jgi:hypothetical protein
MGPPRSLGSDVLVILWAHLPVGMAPALMRTPRLGLLWKALQFRGGGATKTTNNMSLGTGYPSWAVQPASHADGGGCNKRKADQYKNNNFGNWFGHGYTLLVNLLA